MNITGGLSRLRAWRQRFVGDLQGSVLEIGVGTGENLGHYRRARAIYAIEPDGQRAAQAQTKADEVSFHLGIPIQVQVAPAEELPYEDASFDVVVSSLVFCSVTDPARALAEIRRVLRPQGVLWMVEHVRPLTPFWAWLAHGITPGWSRFAYNCHLDRPTTELLQRHGWRVEILGRRSVFVKLRAYHPNAASARQRIT